MISPIFHKFVIVFSVIFIWYVLSTIRRGTLQIPYALVWLFTALAILILAIFPNTITYITRLLGIGLALSAVFFFGIFVCLFILFQHSVSISKHAQNHKRISQELALVKQELKALYTEKLFGENQDNST